MEKKELKKYVNDMEGLGADLFNLTSALREIAGLYQEVNNTTTGGILSVLGDACKKCEDKAYHIWELLRKEV